MKDYYKIIGLTQEATQEEIRKAYRRMAMEYHPDRNMGDREYEEQLKELNEAYQVLGDEEKRRRYDLSSCQQPSRRPMYDREDLSDDLIEIFRVFSRGGFNMRGLGGCKGRGFGKRGCKRGIWGL